MLFLIRAAVGCPRNSFETCRLNGAAAVDAITVGAIFDPLQCLPNLFKGLSR